MSNGKVEKRNDETKKTKSTYNDLLIRYDAIRKIRGK